MRRIGMRIGRLTADRILDEARNTPDALHLMRLFGISALTATQYVRAAHPAGSPHRPHPSLTTRVAPVKGRTLRTAEASAAY
jgi:hypothetical protein